MTEHPTSPFAVAHSSNAPALLQFLEHQSEVLGAVDRQLLWEALAGMQGLKLVDFGCGEGSYLASLIQGAPTGPVCRGSGSGCQFRIGCRSLANAPCRWQPHFRLEDICAPMENNHPGVDVIFTRFTLISAKHPDQAIRNAWKLLRPGGRMVAIESSYSLALAMNTSPVMDEVCKRLIAWYRRAGSRPDEGLELWRRFLPGRFQGAPAI